jgi:hypothetical protein
LNHARARDGAVKKGINFSSPRIAAGMISLVPSGIVALPSASGTILPLLASSTTKTCASINARRKADLSAGSFAARSSMRSISFSGSNMGSLG